MSENDTVAPDAMLRIRRDWFEDYVPIEAARDLERENVALRAERDALRRACEFATEAVYECEEYATIASPPVTTRVKRVARELRKALTEARLALEAEDATI